MPKSTANFKQNPATIQSKKGQNVQAGTAGMSLPSYQEAQDDEIEALRSIFMEDYEDVKTKAAWGSKPTEKSFRLTLRAYSDANVSLVLVTTLTSTYPKTSPLLSLEVTDSVPKITLVQIRKLLSIMPKERPGEVVIHDVATAIQDALEDAVTVQARGAHLPSLEEERVLRESQAMQLQRQKADEDQKNQAHEKAEEDRKFQRDYNEELEKRAELNKQREVPREEGVPASSTSQARILVRGLNCFLS